MFHEEPQCDRPGFGCFLPFNASYTPGVKVVAEPIFFRASGAAHSGEPLAHRRITLQSFRLFIDYFAVMVT
jgi:hypothetical protein